MKYHVRWLPRAEQELAALWLDTLRRAAVTRAAQLLDQQLAQAPGHLGESRPRGRRVHFEAPLGILFRVLEDVQEVEVIHVWEFQ